MTTFLYVASALFILLSLADILTTLRVLKAGGSEKNPLIGKHPKPSTVWLFGLITSAAVLAVAWFVVPHPGPATLFVGIVCAARAYAVVHNTKELKK